MKIDIYEVDGQLTLLDPDNNEQIPVRRKSKRRPTLKDMMELIAVPIQVLDLTPGHGDLMGDARWEICPPFLADGTLLNTGVAPRNPIYASLSSILESHPDLKYYLSKTACLGILRRSDERNKDLPAELKGALMAQSGLAPIQNMIGNLKAYHINQRDEGIDLGEVSGALMATSNMQMQTFITQPEHVVGFDGYNGDLTGDKAATLGVNCGMSTGRNGLIQPIVFAANQRDEVRDLHGITGALQAQPGMKQQTFLAAAFSAGQGAKAGGIGYQEECAPTLKAAESGTNMVPSVLCLNDQGGSMMECTEDMTGTLRAQEHGHQPLVFENHGIDSRYTGPHEVAPTMSSRYGTGGNNIPLVAQEEATVICIAGNTIDRQPQNGGNGFGYQEDISYTLTATDHHAVCQSYQDVVGSLCRRDEKGVGSQYVSQNKLIVETPMLIRRLTPLECERLQGFPDGWTDITAASDSARYKALGNSVAIPCVDFVMRGIAYVFKIDSKKEGDYDILLPDRRGYGPAGKSDDGDYQL